MEQSFTTSELKPINTSIKTIFTEKFSNNDFFKIFETDENIITVIISCPDYDAFKEELLSFVLTIETSFELLLTIIIGGLVQSWHDFQNPCSRLKRLIFTENVKNNYDNNSQIIISEDEDVDEDANETNQGFYYSTQTENKLISSIYSNKTDILQQFISDMIFSNPIANSKKNQELLSVMLYSTLVKILTLINKNEDDVTIDDEHIYLEFRKCSTPIEFSDIFSKYYGRIQNFVKDNQIKQTENFKNDMLDYIDKNYQKDISLSSLAEYTNHSQYYISKLFKSVTGENFKDYLSRIRIDKSIEIINQNPGMNINDIAAAVGLSANTFIKKFHAKTGFTPGTYQSLFSKHNDE